ncbi:MAG: peptidase dimerization protein [Gammaproteobacteria bacterium]|nr:peptidase dimerization protein [Gammaproteobacteria bacterium]
MKSIQTSVRAALLAGSVALLPTLAFAAGQSMAPGRQVAESGPGAPATGIRPQGDTEISIDMSKIKNPDLPKIYNYIDAHIDEHVRNLQKWIQQPSVSNTGEGIQESAQMVKGYFDQLGCQQTRVYDPGITEWGQQSNPVVYARCDEGAKRTIVIYWQYDTMPVTQPDLWIRPPFAGDLVEQAPYKKVLIGRGATNSKGPEMSQWNALISIKAVTGKLPVNIIFVAEGDEERMDVGLRTFVKAHADLFKGAEALYGPGPSEGCLFIELTTSGKSWGRGPVYSDIHGANKRSVDSPAWRHIKMLSTLVADNGNKVLIPGFYDNIEPLTAAEKVSLETAAKKMKPDEAAKNLGVARFIADKPIDIVTMQRHGTSFNLDGIWSGNMFPGGSGAILPNTITSKHNIRYVPNMTGPDIVKKLRAYLDKKGYQDVQIHVVGDVPWAKQRHDTEIAKASDRMFDAFGAERRSPPVENQASIMGGYWPAYLFSGDPINLPIAGGAVGSGGGAHAANEFYVIEGAKKTYGMAGAEKSVATVLYDYAGLN